MRASWVEGLATLLRAEDTGVRVNGTPRARLVFAVNAPGTPAFELCLNRLVSHSHGAQIGAVIGICFDPRQPLTRYSFDEQQLAGIGVRMSG